MNDPDSAFIWTNGLRDDLPERLWGEGDLASGEDWASAGLPGGLINLAFITAALKRRAWLWCLVAVLGLVIGSGMYLKYPPAYHASVSVLLVDNPNQDPIIQIQNDQAMAQSQAVAALAVQQLGLRQSVGSFQAASTVTIVTDNVLTLNVGAPSATDAVLWVNALATDFLEYRAQYAQSEQQQQSAELDRQFSQAEQSLKSINARISQLPAVPASPAQKAELTKLETQRTEEESVEQYVTNTKATSQTATSAMVHDSRLLGDAVSIPRSRLKGAALYIAGGLFGGLAFGMAIVVVSAFLSDRLRRRNDVAEALGVPVRLSVASRQGGLQSPRGRAVRQRDMRRLVAHLRGAVRGNPQGTASLVVAAVDNERDVAQAMVSLAASYAQDGRKVVVADLAHGTLAKLMGAKGPGAQPVSVNGAHMTVAVPDRDDVAPAGPLQTRAQHAPVNEALVAACAGADILLTLTALDPAFGGDHLATWATDAVVIVTAGRSSSERIQAVGEMIRLAGIRLASVVLIGAEKSDESLGATLRPEQSTQIMLN